MLQIQCPQLDFVPLKHGLILSPFPVGGADLLLPPAQKDGKQSETAQGGRVAL